MTGRAETGLASAEVSGQRAAKAALPLHVRIPVHAGGGVRIKDTRRPRSVANNGLSVVGGGIPALGLSQRVAAGPADELLRIERGRRSAFPSASTISQHSSTFLPHAIYDTKMQLKPQENGRRSA